MAEDEDNVTVTCKTLNQKSDWAHFLAQRQKRKQLIKQKAKVHKQSTPKTPTSPHKTIHILNTNANYSHVIHHTQNDSNNLSISWIDLYDDIMVYLCTFCNLYDLENIMLSCKYWHNIITYKDATKWRIWYSAINVEIKSISSLDRTGISNHFIITQNAYSSYDSVYHFSKFAAFARYLLQFECTQNIANEEANTEKHKDYLLYRSLAKINTHSTQIIWLFISGLHKNIVFENEDTDKESSLSSANPELIYLNNYYDTASDTDTTDDNHDIDTDINEENDMIIIDDNEYKDTDKDIIQIRKNIKYIYNAYRYLKHCIKEKQYLKLLYLFENVILLESRPILRWFLYILDRSQCFGEHKKINAKIKKEIGNICDITVFLKQLESYIRRIINEWNVVKHKYNANYLSNHQQYLLKMCVDIDEVRARGVSSLEYWQKSGSMICNPDL